MQKGRKKLLNEFKHSRVEIILSEHISVEIILLKHVSIKLIFTCFLDWSDVPTYYWFGHNETESYIIL